MKTLVITQLERHYQIDGQHLEQCVRYTLTGQITKADNIPATQQADCLDYQIKSARATICKGLNIEQHLQQDKAHKYLYVTKNYIGYVMDKSEYLEFCKTFGTITRDSQKNGGQQKLRLKSEGKKMLQWLTDRV